MGLTKYNNSSKLLSGAVDRVVGDGAWRCGAGEECDPLHVNPTSIDNEASKVTSSLQRFGFTILLLPDQIRNSTSNIQSVNWSFSNLKSYIILWKEKQEKKNCQ